MDKDDFFKILDDVCLFNSGKLITDSDWIAQNSLSFTHKLEENDLLAQYTTVKMEENKVNRIEMNAMKYYDAVLDETSFYEKIKKENDERKADNAYKFAQGVHQNLDEYHERKNSFYEKIISSYANNRYKYNKLSYHNNAILEKYTFCNTFQDTCPGLKPSKNWPVSLDDLLNKLGSAQLEELFHQPFDVSGEFHNEAMAFIKKYFEILTQSEISEEEKRVYEEYLTKSIQALLTIKVMEGNFGRFIEVLDLLNTLRNTNKDYIDYFTRLAFNSELPHANNSLNFVLKNKLTQLVEFIGESKSKLYPIMRNYSINEYFNINKSILFAMTRGIFTNSCSIATDSKYLYIILNGISGGMIKVGTGNSDTVRGKVYLSEKIDSFGEDLSFSWVFVKSKLYMKTASLTFNFKSEFENLYIINPDTFKIEGKTKLLLPEATKHPAIRKKNENFVLLTDGENINVLILEPVLNDHYEKDRKGCYYNSEEEAFLQFEDFYKQQSLSLAKNPYSKNSKQKTSTEPLIPTDIFKSINLMLYTFPISTNSLSQNSTGNLKRNEIEAIEEIYEAFTHLFSKEECKKALILNNWNVSKTAVYLVENEKEIKQPVLIPEKTCLLFQTNLEATFCKNMRTDFKIVKNSPFDTTQYDLLKWTIAEDILIGYKLKEGACIIFSTNNADMKDFTYSYIEKTIHKDIPLGKEGLVVNDDLLNERRFIEEAMQRENLILNKLKMPAFKDIFKEGSDQTQLLLDQGFDYQDYYNMFYLGQPDDKNKTNENNLKSPKIKIVKPAVFNFSKPPGNNNESRPSRPVNMTSSQSNYSNDPSLGYVPTSTTMNNRPQYSFSPYANFSSTANNNSKTKKKLNPKDQKDFTHFIVDYSASEEELLELEKSNAKRSILKEIKDRIEKKEKRETKNNKSKDLEKVNKPKEVEVALVEDRIIEDTVKGTMIKVLSCIQLTKYDNAFCYDQVNKKYYILCNGSLTSLSILISDTFLEKSKFLSDIADLPNYDNTFFNQAIKNFDDLYDKLITVLLSIQIKKPDLCWKYKNWNYYYTHLLENTHYRRDVPVDNYSNDYSYQLLPLQNYQTNSLNIKILLNKIQKTAEINKKILVDQLPADIRDEYKILSLPSSTNEILKRFRTNFIQKNEEGLSWADWNNTSNLAFEKICENSSIAESTSVINPHSENLNIHLDNKRVFFLCMDSELNSLEIIASQLETQTKTGNVWKINIILLLVYFWVENSNHSLILTNKEKTQSILNRIKLILYNLLEETTANNLIYSILISGWELFNESLESQFECFQKFYSMYKRSNPSVQKTQLTNDLELNILKINKTNIAPFKVLLQKLSQQESVYLSNNFNKINLVKTYKITGPDNKHNKTSNKPQFILKQVISSINPRLLSVPFHWILLGYKLSLQKENRKGKNEAKEEINQFTSIEESSDEDVKGSLYKFLSTSNPFEKTTPLSILREKYEKKAYLLSQLDKPHHLSTNMTFSSFYETIDEGELNKLSEAFWEFISKEILVNNEDSMLLLLSDLFEMCVGDVKELTIENSKSIVMDRQHGFIDKTKNYFDKNFLEFLYKNFNFLLEIIRLNPQLNYNNLLSYAHNIVNTMYSKFKDSPMKVLEELQDKLIELLTELSNFKALSKQEDSVLNHVQCLSSTGSQTENEKCLEYNLGTEMTQIYETIKFPGAKTIVVEIEMKMNKEKPCNYDVIIVSEDHGYTNMRYNTNNNFNNYGTCFLMKLNSSLNKKLFLTGEEIKIISPSELEFNKNILGRNKFYSKNSQNNLSKSQSNKSNLNIKCYPYRNVVLGYNKEDESKLSSYINRNNLSTKEDLINWIELIKDLDYYHSFINKALIKSVDNFSYSDKKDQDDPSLVLKEPIVKLGLNNYEMITKEFNEFREHEAFFDNVLDYDLKLDKVYLNNNSNKFLHYLNNIKCFPHRISKDLEVLLNKLADTLSALKTDENFDFDFDSSFLIGIHKKIRETIVEPNNYRNLKFVPSFNSQMKSMWLIVELSFILCMVYHLNLYENFSENDYSKNSILQSALELIGKKLNNLLNWMSGRVTLMKGTFDNLKNYLNEIVDTNNSYIDNIKEIVIKTIRAKKEESKKNKEETIGKTEKIEKEKHKADDTPTKAKNSRDSSNKEKLGFKTPNFKKKINAKRLYQEIPKKKKKEIDKLSHKELYNTSKQNENIEEIPTVEESLEDLDRKPFNYFVEKYPSLIAELNSIDSYKNLKESIKRKIEADIKEDYFGNPDKLKSICEINNLPFNESNLQESLNAYTTFVLKSISKFYNLETSKELEEINGKVLLNQLYTESPYYKMSSFILERLFFLLELNASKHTSDEVSILYKDNSHSSPDPLISKQNSSSQIKTFKDDDYILTDYQQKLLKSMFVFLYKTNDVNLTRSLIQKQFIKMKIREIGIKSATKILKTNDKAQGSVAFLSKLFLNNVGSICNSVKKDLLNEIDIESGLDFINLEDINKILEYNIETFNENIILYKNGKSQNEMKLLMSGAKTDFILSDENISAHHLKNLNLMLSDINILLKFVNDKRNSINSENVLNGINITQLENFILFSTNFIFNYSNNNETDHSNKINKLKSHFADNLKLILAKLISIGTVNNKNISGLVVECLFEALESLMKENKLDLITNVLEDLLFIAPYFNTTLEGNTYLVKLIHKLFELIANSETYETVSLASKICKLLLKNLNNKTNETQPLNQNFFDSIYQKIGKLFLFKNLETEADTQAKLNDKKYFVVVHMNSPEIDYQFLVNALFYWEEKYPTKLSCYKYKEFLDITANGDVQKAKEKLQYVADKYDLNSNPNINANININNTGQKIKMFNYFNILKSKTTKMNLLEKIVDERIANLKIAVEEGNKYLVTKSSTENKDNKSSTDPSTIESIKDRVNKLKLQGAYQNRIRTHIKTAEQIGETACTRGFVCLEPSMTKEMAEELAMVIHKAYNRMLPHFKANINEKVNLFSDELIYPKMPDKDNLLPGCTNTLKETTSSFMNVTLIEESIYERINSAFKNFTDTVKKLSQASGCEEKKSKIGLYNNPNFLFGVGYQTIASVNFNDSTVKRILENNSVSGVSISMIIEDLVNLIYNIYNSDNKCEDLMKNVLSDIKDINKSSWNTISTEKKTKIIGMLIVVGGYYKVLRNNYKAVFKKNSEDVYKILSGGHKTGKTHSHVIFLKDKSAKIEKVNNEDLEKYKQNLRIIKRISLKSLIDALINSFETYVDDRDNMMNKILLHLILKILNEKDIDYDEMINLMENERDNEYKTKIGKFLEILKIISNEVLWIEREENTWETEFIDAFERIYNRIDSNADLIYAPVFYSNLISQDNLSYNPISQEECDSSDLINKFQLPESNYVRQLPKITDFSKCTNALKNIQNFERYMIGEIFNYCQKHYSDDEYFNALHQIRNYFSKGDISNAKLDLNTIFDNNKTNNFLWLPKEHYEIKEITKEECFPGNFYMAKLTGKFIRESGIKSIIKQGGIGINEIPVLLLLHDNTINQALVMYNDQECGKIYTFWVAIDSLMFLENQIKIPANSFSLDQLMKEFKYLEKRLRILYSKNVLSNIMSGLASKRKLNNFEEILHYFSLSTWRTYRNNPISGVFHNIKSFISIKQASNVLPGNALADNKSNSLIRASSSTNSANISIIIEDLVKKVLSENEIVNLNSTDYKILDTCLERIINDLKIDNLPANQKLLNWCMEKWDDFDKNFIKIRTNLFTEYNVNFDEKLRNKNIFNIGNFSRKMLALHELSNIDKSNYAGLVLTFEKDAFLGPHAKISFYSDPYGENLIEEIVSIKSIKYNLESVVFNYPKVWMYYTPGTRIFYAYQWNQTNRDSQLACSIVFVPHIWSILISLTDVCTSGLFVNIDTSTLEVFKKIIQKLLVHCTALNFPAELQRRIFNLTNRVILKASKYLSLLEVQKKIKLSELSISNKFNIIGIDEFIVTQLINNINNFNSNRNSEMNFSSVYVVEGVEIIISILSVIKESFNSLDQYLRETFDYALPVWIEAVIKLGQFLNFFQGSSNLEGVLMKEIYDQLSINSQFENIIILQNIPGQIDDSIIREELTRLLINSQAKVVDVDKDIQIFKESITISSKTCVILIDGFLIDNLGDPAEEVKKEPEEEPFWLCYYCEMENDKDNTSCVFCEKAKKTKVKEVKKEKPKSSLIKVDSYNNTVAVRMENLKNNLKNSEKLSTLIIEEKAHVVLPPTPNSESSEVVVNTEPVVIVEIHKREIKNLLSITQGKDLRNKGVDYLLNNYLLLRLRDYVKEGDYIYQKLRNLENYPLVRKYISKELDALKNIMTEEKTRRQDASDPEIKTDLLKLYETLQNNGVDLWLENVILDPQSRNNEINIKLMETIRELVDLKICKEKNISLILPAVNLRFIPTEFNSLNHSSYSLLINNFNELRNIPLSVIRFYWVIIKYFNNCLSAALPFIKPPDAYSNTNDNLKQDEEGYINISLPKTMSAFLSSARGITFSFTKQNLVKDIIDNTEFNEDEVQIPTFKFERLNIKNQLEKNEKQPKANGTNLYSNFNMRKSSYAADEVEAIQLRENKQEMKSEESMFLQAYEQAKEVDPAFFRSKKMPGDPLVAFKVNLKGENVEGIGGPYRQFFSDISAELQDKDYKNKKILDILIPTSNNQADKGEFKDRWTINPSYNNITALNQFEFFGILMGICIRTGVHLTLDLSSILWKKITDESITAEDIFEFDQGLYRLIEHLSQTELTEETFEEKFNQNFVIELTDGTVHELIPNGANIRVAFPDRFKFISLAVKARVNEADTQISSMKKGLCQMIPNSLIKLLTFKELERLVCGVKTVDISMLKTYTKLAKDLTLDSNRVKWLWDILEEISEEEKIKFVKFCWAQERLPSTHQEFQKLQVTFTIKSYMDKTRKDVFPRADTCFFSIELPDYSSKEIMKKLILQAINLDNVGLNADKVNAENIQLNDYGGIRNNYYDDEDDEMLE